MRRLYLPLADIATSYDNSDDSDVVIATKAEGEELRATDSARWTSIEEASR